MALSQSFKATSIQTLKSAEMSAVPNTEDLRRMLTKCALQRKPVLLRYTSPGPGLGFVLKVSPAIGDGRPRWTFEVASGIARNAMWTHDTGEEAVIQDKPAIDTIYINLRQDAKNSKNTEDTAVTPADATLLGQVVSALTDPQTYLATYAAFTYFLLRQYSQYQMTATSFAVVVFEITIKQNGVAMAIPQEVFRSIAERIRPLLSPLDVVTHVREGEFAVLLCYSDGADACRFARSLYETISRQSILPEGVEAEESIVIGASALTETCRDPGELLAAAREAKEVAIFTSRPYLLSE